MELYPEIAGIGYCGLDYISVVPRIPVDGKVEIMDCMTQGGGPSATAVVTAARLGAKTAFMGAVGDDERGGMILKELAKEGVDIRGVKVRGGGVSPVSFCWVEATGGKRSIAWTKGSVQSLHPSEVDMDLIKNAKALHLDAHQTEAAIAAAEAARKNGVTVSLDAGTILPGIEKLIKISNIIIASEEFALDYTGESCLEKAVKKLFNNKCVFSGATMGDRGAVGYDGKSIINQSPFEVDAADTTGAGDVFHGAFIFKYIKGGKWDECMQFSSAASALKCRSLGGRTGIPSLSETEKFLSAAAAELRVAR